MQCWLADMQRDPDPKKRTPKSRAYPTFWSKIRHRWCWDERAEAWDKADRAKATKRLQNRRLRWESKWLELRDKAWDTSQKLIQRAEEMLEYPLTNVRLETDDTGGQITVIEPTKWSIRDAGPMLSTAMELAKIAADRNSIVQPLEAIDVLIRVGWIPDWVGEIAAHKMDDVEAAMRQAFGEQFAGYHPIEPTKDANPDAVTLDIGRLEKLNLLTPAGADDA
jgi:hypothetical protein